MAKRITKNSLGSTSNFRRAGGIPTKTRTVTTSVVTLKPRRYATTGRV